MADYDVNKIQRFEDHEQWSQESHHLWIGNISELFTTAFDEFIDIF